MTDVIKSIFYLMDKKTRQKYIGLQLFFLFSALFQVVGIASIGPFITVLSNQDMIHTNAVLNAAYSLGGFTSNIQFIVALAVASLVLIVISNAVAGLTMWLTFRFSILLGSSLQASLYEMYLFKDYIYHKSNNYNKLIAMISQQVPRFIYMVVQPFLLLTSQLFVAVIILIGLLVLDPLLAVIAGVLIGGSYVVTFLVLKSRLQIHGDMVTYKNTKVQSILSESMIGIKDVKLGALEERYRSVFNKINVKGLNSQAFISLSGELPRFVIESISFSAILVLALVLITTRSDVTSVIPILSIYALAGYKLLPTMQQIYKSISSLSGHGSVARGLKLEVEHWVAPKERNTVKKQIQIEQIDLRDVTFRYPEEPIPAIKNANVSLTVGNLYSIVGHSGSGKSTLADILLGLLEPESGTIAINGKTLPFNEMEDFRNSLGYVSQHIFILDDSVIRNVAFGIASKNIDLDRIRYALKMANAIEFVDKLPQGLDTNLGQDGKLLSGGQRQRIGIARALYKESTLLLLDEPTSALDIESEFSLLETLNSIKKDIIILIISHRPTPILMSDEIILMKEGHVQEKDTYANLTESNPEFKNMMDMASSNHAA